MVLQMDQGIDDIENGRGKTPNPHLPHLSISPSSISFSHSLVPFYFLIFSSSHPFVHHYSFLCLSLLCLIKDCMKGHPENVHM